MMHIRNRIRRLAAGVVASAVMLCAGVSQLPVTAQAATAEETFCQRVRTAWENGTTTVSMRNLSLTLDEVSALYYNMLYTESSWFYVSSSFSYATNTAGKVAAFEVKYNCETNQIASRKKALENKIQELVSYLQPGWSDAEKLLYFHDWLATHVSYDLTYTYGDAYAALITGSSVCQGYSLAMCLLAREAGIPCYAIVSDEINHMWNVVQIGGEWYQLDVTFDDYAPDMIGHAAHQFLLRSDAYMMADADHSATDWRTFSEGIAITCGSDAYDNAFWHDSMDAVTPMPDGTWIFARGNDPDAVKYSSDVKAVITRADASGSEKQLYTITDGHWLTERGSVYTICYTTAEVYNDRIYYITPNTIYSLNMQGGDKQTVYTLTAAEKAEGSIYGMMIDRETGVLTYQIQPLPSYPDETLQLDVYFDTLQLDTPAAVTTTSERTTTETEAVTTTAEPETTTTTVTETTTTPAPETTTPAPAETTTISPETTEPAETTLTSDTAVLLPARNTDVAVTCLSEDTQPVWDEEGHYRGTNALWSVHLELVTQPEIAFPVELPVDLTGIKVNLIEERRFNINSYDVSGMLQVIGYGYTDDSHETFYIDLTTDYTVNDQLDGMLEPLRLTFSEKAETTVSEPETTTETTVQTTAVLLPQLKGDADASGVVNIADAVLMARFLAEDKEISMSAQGRLNADCNGDGDLTVEDAGWILQFLAGLI